MWTDCAAEAAAVLAGTTADVVGLLNFAPRRAAPPRCVYKSDKTEKRSYIIQIEKNLLKFSHMILVLQVSYFTKIRENVSNAYITEVNVKLI